MHVPSRVRLFLPVVALCLAFAGLGCPKEPGRGGPGPGPGFGAGGPSPGSLVVSAFYVAPVLKGGPDEAIRVANVSDGPVDLADCSLSDVLGPSSGTKYVQRGKGLRRDIVFPSDSEATVVQPGGEVTVARDALSYFDQFGEWPDFELGEDSQFPDNEAAVPDMLMVASGQVRRSAKSLWPTWPAAGADVIVLFGPPDGLGDTPVLDVVVWDFKPKGKDPLLQDELREYERLANLPEGSLWEGPALDPWGELASPYGPKSRVFRRDRDVAGRILPDTNSYRDWDSGSSLKHLGEDPTHRIEIAGQSDFLAQQSTERAVITMTSAPDNNCRALKAAWDEAEREILVSVYYLDQLDLMDTLVAAVERGVDVTLWLEGTTVGVKHGFPDAERYVAKTIEEAGRERSGNPRHGLGRVYWLRTDAEQDISDRYWYDHSKYSIIDGRTIVIGSENYGGTGHPTDPSGGNRGWEIQIATPPGAPPLQVVENLLAVWHDDLDPENHKDVIRYTDDPGLLDGDGRGRYGPPPTSFDPAEKRLPKPPGGYVPVFPDPVTVDEEATFELVLSPDTSLNETGAILGAIARAKEEILIQHLDLRLYWGSRVRSVARTPQTTPSLLLEALVAAARRGVRVRVLVDCSKFGCQRGPEEYDRARDSNDDTVAWLRELADREGLDIEARLIDLDTPAERRGEDNEDAGFSKIHNKGMVIDRRVVQVSSINGSENSFKGNREVGVIVESPSVAAYYAYLFWYDWMTIAAPRDLRVEEAGATVGEGRAHALLTGLPPRTEHFVRIAAYDGDRSDRDQLDLDVNYGPHESAFSAELTARSSAAGEISLSWEPNVSERLEGDLVGYRVYWGLASGAQASTAADAAKLGLYAGASTTLGPSPLDLPKEVAHAPAAKPIVRVVPPAPKPAKKPARKPARR